MKDRKITRISIKCNLGRDTPRSTDRAVPQRLGSAGAKRGSVRAEDEHVGGVLAATLNYDSRQSWGTGKAVEKRLLLHLSSPRRRAVLF